MPPVISSHLLYGTAWILYLGAGFWGIRYLISSRERSFLTMQACLLAGLLMHTAWLGWRVAHGASWIPYTLSELIIELSWALVLFWVMFGARSRTRLLGISMAWVTTSLVGVGGVLAHRASFPQAHVYGLWLTLHSASLILSYAAFLVACTSGLIYLVAERWIKQKRLVRIYPWFPSLDGLDEVLARSLFIGFCLMSLGLVTGFASAQTQWGSMWRWDAKELGSIAMWATYAAALWLRWQAAWRGRRLAWLAVGSFGLVLFTCLGVNYLIPSEHVFF